MSKVSVTILLFVSLNCYGSTIQSIKQIESNSNYKTWLLKGSYKIDPESNYSIGRDILLYDMKKKVIEKSDFLAISKKTLIKNYITKDTLRLFATSIIKIVSINEISKISDSSVVLEVTFRNQTEKNLLKHINEIPLLETEIESLKLEVIKLDDQISFIRNNKNLKSEQIINTKLLINTVHYWENKISSNLDFSYIKKNLRKKKRLRKIPANEFNEWLRLIAENLEISISNADINFDNKLEIDMYFKMNTFPKKTPNWINKSPLQGGIGITKFRVDNKKLEKNQIKFVKHLQNKLVLEIVTKKIPNKKTTFTLIKLCGKSTKGSQNTCYEPFFDDEIEIWIYKKVPTNNYNILDQKSFTYVGQTSEIFNIEIKAKIL
jgi:hypothetical protein